MWKSLLIRHFKTQEKFNKIVETVEVQTCTLEKFFVDQKITKITLLKIDIGQDYEVPFKRLIFQ